MPLKSTLISTYSSLVGIKIFSLESAQWTTLLWPTPLIDLQGDFDRAFRLLLPLQAEASLPAEANASLHASLALAYENEADTLRGLEQRTLAENDLTSAEDVQQQGSSSGEEQNELGHIAERDECKTAG